MALLGTNPKPLVKTLMSIKHSYSKFKAFIQAFNGNLKEIHVNGSILSLAHISYEMIFQNQTKTKIIWAYDYKYYS